MGRITARRPVVRLSTRRGALPPDRLARGRRTARAAGRRPAADRHHAHPWFRHGAGRRLPARGRGHPKAGDIKTCGIARAPTPTAARPTTCWTSCWPRASPRPTRASSARSSPRRRAGCAARPDRSGAPAQRLRRRRSAAGVPAVLAGLPEALRREQATFERTGGLHAAGLFDAPGSCCAAARTSAGTTRWTRCSAGRFQPGGAGRGPLLMVSGRASFELRPGGLVNGVPVGHYFIQPPPAEVHADLPHLLVMEPVQLLVRRRPVDISVGPRDETIQRHSHRVDELPHHGPPRSAMCGGACARPCR